MAHNSNKEYADQVKLLKKIGVIGKDYNLNNKLSAGQKSNVTKKWAIYAHVARHPEEFQVRYVAKEHAREFQESGIKGVSTAKKFKAFIRADPGSTVQVRVPRKTKADPRPKPQVWITNPEGTRRERRILSRRKDLPALLEEYGNKKFPSGQYLTIQVGGHNPVKRKFTGAPDMMKYVNAKMTGDNWRGKPIDKWHSDDAVEHIAIVEVLNTAFADKAKARQASKAKNRTGKAKGKAR